jgi:predicted dienelactone hydrolase
MVTGRVLVAAALLLAPVAAHARCTARTSDFLRPLSAVGVRTLDLDDASRPTPAHGPYPALPSRHLPTEVWYPTAGTPGRTPVRDAPPAHGRFPLVVFAHALLDFRIDETYVLAHLASRGFVVAALDFPLTNLATAEPRLLSDLQNQPGDVTFVIDELLRRASTHGEWLQGRIERRRIGVAGYSYGGATVVLLGYHPTLRDRRVRAVLALAPFSCFGSDGFYRHGRPRLMVAQGDQDVLVPYADNGLRTFEGAVRSPRELVTLVNASHTAFSGAVTAPSMLSYDQIGCTAVAGGAEEGEPFAGLGGAADGIDPSGCISSSTCGPLPTNAPMQAMRQHTLAQVFFTAFFEETLRRSRPARCFLRTRFAAENPDVTVQTAKPGR